MRQLILGLLLTVAALAQSQTVEIAASDRWKDSGIDVQAGDLVKFEAAGKLKFADSALEATPEGLKRGWLDMVRTMQLNQAGRGALIGRVGDAASARPFLIGERREARMVVSGRLFIGVNQPESSAKGDGSYSVKVEIMAKASATQQNYTGPLPQLTKEQWAQIPQRVVDAEGTEGDRKNFIIFGEQSPCFLRFIAQSINLVAFPRVVILSVLNPMFVRDLIWASSGGRCSHPSVGS